MVGRDRWARRRASPVFTTETRRARRSRPTSELKYRFKT